MEVSRLDEVPSLSIQSIFFPFLCLHEKWGTCPVSRGGGPYLAGVIFLHVNA